jgi:Zn-dependent protease with chaperone function
VKLKSIVLSARITKSILILSHLAIIYLFYIVADKLTLVYFENGFGWVLLIFWAYHFRQHYITQNTIKNDFDHDNDNFLDLQEYLDYLRRTSDTLSILRFQRFMDALKSVYNRTHQPVPNIYIMIGAPQDEESKYLLASVGINHSRTIIASHQSIQADDIDQDMIAFALAHEVGHDNLEDNITRVFINSLSSMANFSLNILLVISIFTLQPIFLGLVILTKIILLLLDNLYSRQREYMADAFASKLGFATGGVKFFRHLLDSVDTSKSLHVIFQTHPPIKKRLENQQAFLTGDQGRVPDSLEYVFYSLLFITLVLAGHQFLPYQDLTSIAIYYIASCLIALQIIILSHSRYMPDKGVHDISSIISTGVMILLLFLLPGSILSEHVSKIFLATVPVVTVGLIILRINFRSHMLRLLHKLAEIAYLAISVIILINLF